MTHAVGPDSVIDILLAIIALIVVLVAFYLAVLYTIRPGEESPDHIKRRILEERGRDSS